MVETPLRDIREHIKTLASDTGSYYVVCGRTGERPVPTAGRRFENRTVAETAARAAEQYRAALRVYDPRVRHYDLIVVEDTGPQSTRSAPSPQHRGDAGETPPLREETDHEQNHQLVEFCHGVAAAVFETLCEEGYRNVETAVMDAYFTLAETVGDPDELCLCLLERVAAELDTRLRPAEQADVLARAASRLEPATGDDDPLTATLASLQRVGLVGAHTCSPWSVDVTGETCSVVVELADYALTPQNGRLPVVPVVVDLFRRNPQWSPSSFEAVAVDDRWRLTLTLAKDATPDGLASAPIDSEVS